MPLSRRSALLCRNVDLLLCTDIPIPPPRPCSFYDKKAPIYTMSRFLPPSKILDASVTHTIVGDGCVIKSGSTINNCVVGIRSLIGHDCNIQDTLIMGSDYYETLEECEFVPGCLPMGVGDKTTIRKAIIDKNARIGENCQVRGKLRHDSVGDRQR